MTFFQGNEGTMNRPVTPVSFIAKVFEEHVRVGLPFGVLELPGGQLLYVPLPPKLVPASSVSGFITPSETKYSPQGYTSISKGKITIHTNGKNINGTNINVETYGGMLVTYSGVPVPAGIRYGIPADREVQIVDLGLESKHGKARSGWIPTNPRVEYVIYTRRDTADKLAYPLLRR
jgi:hypothetical protein